VHAAARLAICLFIATLFTRTGRAGGETIPRFMYLVAIGADPAFVEDRLINLCKRVDEKDFDAVPTGVFVLRETATLREIQNAVQSGPKGNVTEQQIFDVVEEAKVLKGKCRGRAPTFDEVHLPADLVTVEPLRAGSNSVYVRVVRVTPQKGGDPKVDPEPPIVVHEFQSDVGLRSLARQLFEPKQSVKPALHLSTQSKPWVRCNPTGAAHPCFLSWQAFSLVAKVRATRWFTREDLTLSWETACAGGKLDLKTPNAASTLAVGEGPAACTVRLIAKADEATVAEDSRKVEIAPSAVLVARQNGFVVGSLDAHLDVRESSNWPFLDGALDERDLAAIVDGLGAASPDALRAFGHDVIEGLHAPPDAHRSVVAAWNAAREQLAKRGTIALAREVLTRYRAQPTTQYKDPFCYYWDTLWVGHLSTEMVTSFEDPCPIALRRARRRLGRSLIPTSRFKISREANHAAGFVRKMSGRESIDVDQSERWLATGWPESWTPTERYVVQAVDREGDTSTPGTLSLDATTRVPRIDILPVLAYDFEGSRFHGARVGGRVSSGMLDDDWLQVGLGGGVAVDSADARPFAGLSLGANFACLANTTGPRRSDLLRPRHVNSTWCSRIMIGPAVVVRTDPAVGAELHALFRLLQARPLFSFDALLGAGIATRLDENLTTTSVMAGLGFGI
jgi:hypothetical protein